jgi:hypothetical protein
MWPNIWASGLKPHHARGLDGKRFVWRTTVPLPNRDKSAWAALAIGPIVVDANAQFNTTLTCDRLCEGYRANSAWSGIG